MRLQQSGTFSQIQQNADFIRRNPDTPGSRLAAALIAAVVLLWIGGVAWHAHSTTDPASSLEPTVAELK
jgi:hypothetical protein